MRRAVVGSVLVALAIALVWWWRGHATGKREVAKASAPLVHVARPRANKPAAPRGSIAGRVTGKDGQPIAGAVISIVLAADAASLRELEPTVVQTEGDGRYRVTDLDAGAYKLAATARGHVPRSAEKIRLEPGQDRAGVDLMLDAGGTLVHGIVTDPEGDPIAGVRVTAQTVGATGLDTRAVALSGPDGRYELTVADGYHHITTWHEDYIGRMSVVNVSRAPVTLDLVMVPGSVVHGTVIARDSGQPVAGAHVTASSGESGPEHFPRGEASYATSGPDGTFTLRNVTSGTISLSAVASGYVSTAETALAIGVGDHVDGVRILVEPAVSIHGRVVTAGSDHGVAGAQVFASPPENNPWPPEATTDADGAFEIIGVQRGTYKLATSAEGLVESDEATVVEVTDADVTGVKLAVATGRTLAGRVDPPARVTLALRPKTMLEPNAADRTAFRLRAETDEHGQFTLRGAPHGSFVITATSLDAAGKLPVTIGDSDQTNLVIRLEQLSRISGQVLDTAGAPVAAARVKAEGTAGSRGTFGATSGDNGTFEISGVPPGRYVVSTYDLGAIPADPRDGSTSITVDVATGADVHDITLTRPAKDGVIRGVVLGPDGTPEPDAWIYVEADQARTSPLNWLAMPPISRRDGTFTTARLLPGKYALIVESADANARGEKRGVETGETVTIQLQSMPALVVRVTEAGRPVREYDIWCESDHDFISRRGSAGADGTFRVERAPPGSYKCTISAAEGVRESTLTIVDAPASLEVALKRWAVVTGTLVDTAGKPVANAEMSAMNADVPIFGIESAQTDAGGRFRLTKVVPRDGELELVTRLGDVIIGAIAPYRAQPGENVDLGTIEMRQEGPAAPP